MKSNISMIKSGRCILLVSLCGFLSNAIFAEPGFEFVRLPHITPAEADAALSSQSPAPLATMSTMATMATSSMSSLDIELQELARGLKHDPDLIYQYVHDNIELEPIFGELKGPFMTVMDRRGTSFDQAALMVTLLRESGYTANYMVGHILITFDQAASWLGIKNTDPLTVQAYVQAYLTQGGIPNEEVNGQIQISHAWVKVEIDGTWYVFDPSFKEHVRTDALANLANLINYNQSDFLTAVCDDPDSYDGTSISNLNHVNLNQKLVEYSQSLVNQLKNEHHSADMADIIGGLSIVPLEAFPRQTELTYQYGTPTELPEIDSYKTELLIQLPGTAFVSFWSSDVYGRKLTVTYENDQPVLKLDGVEHSRGAAASSGTSQTLNYTVRHPLMTEDSAYHYIKAGGMYCIMNGWGSAEKNIIAKYRKDLRQSLSEAGGANSQESLINSLMIMNLTWLAQESRYESIAAAMADGFSRSLHAIGICGQYTSPYLDIRSRSANDVFNDDSSYSAYYAMNYTQTNLASALEWGTIAQCQPGADAVSTIRLMDEALAKGGRIFRATSSNFTTIRTPLESGGYSTETLNGISTYLNANPDSVYYIPENGLLGVSEREDAWHGYGYFAHRQNSSGGESLLYAISGDYNGGYGAYENLVADPSDVDSSTVVIDMVDVNSSMHAVTTEPIDLVSGKYLYDHTDLATGSGDFPQSLRFARSYNSASVDNDGPMGKGWSHNYEITAKAASDGFQTLGEDSPIDAAAAIVATFINLDLLKTERNLKNVTISTMVTKWLMDQMIDNTVTVSQPGSAMQYTKLPDGTFNPPPGKSGTLDYSIGENNNKRYHLEDKNGNELQFNEAGLIETWTDLVGRKVNFTYDTIEHVNPTDSSTIFFYNKVVEEYELGLDNLISYWSFDDNASVLYDWAKGVNNAYVNGATFTSAGRFGGAYCFDGNSSDHISIDNTSTNDPYALQEFTLSFWAKIDDFSFGSSGVFKGDSYQQIYNGQWMRSWGIRFYGGKAYCTLVISSSFTTSMNADVLVGDNNWHMWTMTVSKVDNIPNLWFYKDGALVGHRSYASGYNVYYSIPDRDIIAGHKNGKSIQGAIDDVRFYNKALNEEEIGDVFARKQVINNYYTEYKLKKVSNDFGQELNFSYNDNNTGPYIASVSDKHGRSVSFGRNANSELTSYTDPEDENTTYTYNADGWGMESIYYPASYEPDADGISDYPFVINTYNDLGQVKEQTNANGDTYQYHYTGFRAEEVNPYNDSIIHYFDEHGKTLSVADQCGNTVTSEYDGQQRLVRTTMPEGNSVSYKYDKCHNVTETCSNVAGSEQDRALAFNGTSDYIVCGNSGAGSSGEGSFSMSAWIKLDASVTFPLPNGSTQQIVSKRLGAKGFSLYLDSDGRLFFYFNVTPVAETALTACSEIEIQPGGWQHVLVCADRAGDMRLYIDGIESTVLTPDMTEVVGSADTTIPLTVGRSSDVSEGFFHGYVDDVCLIGRALTASEVLAITQRTFDFAACQNLMLHWKYDDNSDSTSIADSAGANEGISQQNTDVISVGGASGFFSIARATYEPVFNHIETTTDNVGNVSRYYYYPSGSPLYGLLERVEEPARAGQVPVTVYTYYSDPLQVPSFGQVKTVTSPEQIVTEYIYYGSSDPVPGALKQSISDKGEGRQNFTTEYTYDVYGNALSIKDPRNHMTAYEYDLNRRVKKETRPDNYWTTTLYYPSGDVKEVKSQTGLNQNPYQTTRYTYTNNGKTQTATRIEADETTHYQYDKLDRVEIVTDAEQHTTKTTYYKDGKRHEAIDADNVTTVTKTYTPNGYLKTIKDANNNTTVYDYDKAGRLIRTEYAVGPAEYQSYAGGLLKTATNRSGQTTAFAYDHLGRLKIKRLPAADGYVVRYTYDFMGRLVDEMDSRFDGSATHHDYDDLGRLETVIYPGGKAVGYSYYGTDSVYKGNLKQVQYPSDDATINPASPAIAYVTYAYDVMDRISSVYDDQGGLLASYQYDAYSRPSLMSYGNNAYVQYGFDNAEGRMGWVQNGSSASGVIDNYSYLYDKVGNRRTMTVNGSENHTYGYDNNYQLESVDYPQEHFTADSIFDYDPVGNRLYSSGPSIADYVPNALNQYASVNSTRYSYDDQGNLAHGREGSFGYDSQNRLRYAAMPNGTTEYQYDASGRRISKTLPDQSTTRYLYDGDQVICEYAVVGYQDVLVRQYVYGPGIDRPICMINCLSPLDLDHDGIISQLDVQELAPKWMLSSSQNGYTAGADLSGNGYINCMDAEILAEYFGTAGRYVGVYYYHFDGLGSVTALSDQTGHIAETYQYSAFGITCIIDSEGVEVVASKLGNPYNFTARRLDSETDLYYYRARMYSPNLGRFLQTDPVGYADGLNWYAYCGNNPVLFWDPWGLCGQQRGFWGAAWEGAWKGDFADNTSWGGMGAQIGIGMIPIVGQIADARDTVANIRNVWNNPRSGGAWAGLGGSVLGWVPLVGDAAKTGIRGGRKVVTEVGQAASRNLDNAAGAVRFAGSSVSGSYTNHHVSGMTYSGKGSMGRAQQSAAEKAIEYNDAIDYIDWTPSNSHRQAFKDEFNRLKSNGGPRSPTNYNKIESPGKKYIDEDGF